MRLKDLCYRSYNKAYKRKRRSPIWATVSGTKVFSGRCISTAKDMAGELKSYDDKQSRNYKNGTVAMCLVSHYIYVWNFIKV
jgi:hypothetical protein